MDQARRQQLPRRTLDGMDGFSELSPEIGEIDEQAVSDAMEEDPDLTLDLVAAMTAATDVELQRLARRLAARIFLDLTQHAKPDTSGPHRLVSAPYRPDAGDLDLDRTIEGVVTARAERRAIEADDIRVLSWAKASTAWCLLVDSSGSMNGKPTATASLAAAAVAARAPGDYAVLSFSNRVIAAKAMWENRSPSEVIDRLLALKGHGTTNLEAALNAAQEQLERSSAKRRVVVLLSDCRATEPGDFVAAAKSIDTLVIISPDEDSEAAEELANQVGARWTTLDGPSDVVGAFGRVLDQ